MHYGYLAPETPVVGRGVGDREWALAKVTSDHRYEHTFEIPVKEWYHSGMEFPHLREAWCIVRRHHRQEPDSVTDTPVGPMMVERCRHCGSIFFHIPIGDLTDNEIDEFVAWLET